MIHLWLETDIAQDLIMEVARNHSQFAFLHGLCIFTNSGRAATR